MKLMITLRYDAHSRGRIKVETDYKYESLDTPTINKYGLELLAAFVSGVRCEGEEAKRPKKMYPKNKIKKGKQ